MNEEKKIEILYDHYKDTFENQKVSLNKRNFYTLICLGLIALLSFQITNPEESTNISNELIRKNIGDIEINFNYINSILIFALLWIVIMYYQINFQIEKIYKYLQEIELDLTNEMKPFEISREGKTYLDHYPWLSEFVHRIYTIVFPIAIIFVTVLKWFSEKKLIYSPFKNGHFWIDSVLLFCIVLTSLLYLFNRHFNDFSKNKQTQTGNNVFTK